VSGSELGDAFAAAQLHQPWALRIVYDALAPQVHGYLRVRGAGEPEELTSDVLLTVIKALPSITGGVSGLRTFTFSVAHARLVDALRAQNRRPQDVPYEPVRDTRRSTSAEDDALTLGSAERAQQLLARLPEDQRTVLSLRIIADLSLEEVAAAIGRSQGAVKQLQRRALIALKSEISRETSDGA
jgi:RNA polymerase sigma-70 factor (ECF subfamily)